MTDRVVAVDLGNTAVKLGVHVPDRGQDSQRDWIEHAIPIDQSEWHVSAIRWVENQIGDCSAQWRIASVHRFASDRLGEEIRRRKAGDSVCRITRHVVPMPVRVDFPDQLGIDRLVAAHAASRRHRLPLVLVDAGSAVTVDWVNSAGEFCGGAILPGLGLQFAALASGTDALPYLDSGQAHRSLVRTEENILPAKNTAEAIRLGVLTSISAGIDRLARSYARAALAGESHCLVLTGGDAEAISRHLTHSHVVDPNLVCRGLLDLPRSTLRGTNPSEELE